MFAVLLSKWHLSLTHTAYTSLTHFSHMVPLSRSHGAPSLAHRVVRTRRAPTTTRRRLRMMARAILSLIFLTHAPHIIPSLRFFTLF